MTATLALFAHLFEWVRWIGVAYLVYLGVQAWRSETLDLRDVRAEPRDAKSIFLRGFLVSFTNPKTLLFYGAFFSQFLVPGDNATAHLVVLSVTFLSIAVLVDFCWALAAAQFRRVLAIRGRLRNRLTGGFYLSAAFGLAMARKPS